MDEFEQPFQAGQVSRRQFLTRALATGLALGGSQLLLQSCGSASADAQSLNFANWASAEATTKDEISTALQAFEKQSNVAVNNIALPFNETYQQIVQMTQANIALDVMELSGTWPQALGGAGSLVDLKPFVSQSWSDDAFPNSFAAGTYKGAIYAVPFSITPHGLWYNKTLIKQAGLDPAAPPATIDEFNHQLAVMRSVFPDTVYPLGIDLSNTYYALIGFWPWIWTFGGNPMVDDGHGNVTNNWTDAGTTAAFQWLQMAVDKRWTPNKLDISAERRMIAFNQIAYKLDGPYLTGDLINLNPAYSTVEKVNQNFGVTSTPRGATLKTSVTCADIHNLGMSSLTKNQQLSWQLINFLTTSNAVITSFLIPEGGMLPYRSYNSNAYAGYYSDPISQSFITDVIPTMRAPAFGIKYPTANTAIVQAMVDIANGSSVVKRLQQLNEEVKSIYHS